MRKFMRLADWSPGYINVCPQHVVIRVKCSACNAEREFDRNSLPSLLHHASVEDIESRMKCASCDKKAAKLRFGFYVEGEE